MALFCPLAEDVGTAAEWVAVIVALFGAIAVFMVSLSANKTAKAAMNLQSNDFATRKAASDREAQLILIHLEPELREARSGFSYLNGGVSIVGMEDFIASQSARKNFSTALEAISLTLSKELFPRWHVLPDWHAVDLARVVSGLEVLKSAVAEAAQVDLSETMPGAHRESFDEFRRESIASAYRLLSSGVSEMEAALVRLIDAAVIQKQALMLAGDGVQASPE